VNTPNSKKDYDAIIIGAGMSGLYQLHKIRQLGLSARIFETGSGVGGTWYWTRLQIRFRKLQLRLLVFSGNPG